MYNALKRLYSRGKDETILINAVKKGWLSEDDKAKIMEEVG